MRAILILVLLASPAAAEPLVLGPFERAYGNIDVHPATLYFRFAGGGYSVGTVGQIPGIDANQSPQTWTIDATTAATYGFDWDAVANWIPTQVSPGFAAAMGRTPFGSELFQIAGTDADNNRQRLVGFQIDHVVLDIPYWIIQPGVRAFKVVATIYGDGLVAPEPTTILMAQIPILIASLFLLCKRRCGLASR